MLRWIERFPSIIYLGAGVLAFTAAGMIVEEPLLDALFDPRPVLRIATYAALVASVVGIGWWTTRSTTAV